MKRLLIGSAVLAGAVLGASTASADGIKPPHDASNNIECLDCHALGIGDLGISKARFDAQELLCKSCHNPTGQASTMSDVGLHVVEGGATIVDCGSCHSVHFPQLTSDPVHTGGVEAENLSLIRGDTAKYVPGAVEPAIFHVAPDDFVFETAPYNGICQTCHQDTAYFRNDGSAPMTHGGGADCGSCHGHSAGFPGTCTTCHSSAQDNGDGIPAAGRRGLAGELDVGIAHSHKGGLVIGDADCAVCHSGATHADGMLDLVNADDGSLVTFETLKTIGSPPVDAFCGSCHDADGAAGATNPMDPFGSGHAPADVYAEYIGSGHADTAGQAFTYSSATGVNCAKCHTQNGFLDFLGADGTASGTVESAAQLGTTVSCTTCHNAVTPTLTSVTFPSGVQVTGLGPEALCMQCHQGRSSTVNVDTYLTGQALATEDTVKATMSFQNVHYFEAGATLYGGVAMGGYQYATEHYDVKNHHVEGYDTCLGCHNQHSLELKLGECATCHAGVTTVADLADVRVFGSTGDYDGDGDTAEGMEHELAGLAEVLLLAIKAYGVQVAGTAIAYNPASHPYFYVDANGNGVVDAGETAKYNAFTARLIKACYNYQYYKKDPGAYAHHPKYVVEILHDSINDLNAVLAAPVAFAGDRADAGHFDGASEAFRHWDEVSASCTKCHTGSGFVQYVTAGTTTALPSENGMKCSTCHSDLVSWALRAVDSVTYPGGAVVSAPGNPNNICGTCHSGRESKASVDTAIATNKLSFKNVHYLPAASVVAGSTAHVGYEYDGKIYAGKKASHSGMSCVMCHSPETTEHSFDVHDNAAACFATCHTEYADIPSIRFNKDTDYDGDGSKVEPLAGEIAGLEEALYAQMQAVAAANGTPLAYSAASHPYFFADTNGNGVVDPDEAQSSNSFKGWTPALLKASFNYQLSHKEPGGWAHNFKYVAQLLYDSIQDLGGNVGTLVRPN